MNFNTQHLPCRLHLPVQFGGCVAALVAEQQDRTRQVKAYQSMEEACVTGGCFMSC